MYIAALCVYLPHFRRRKSYTNVWGEILNSVIAGFRNTYVIKHATRGLEQKCYQEIIQTLIFEESSNGSHFVIFCQVKSHGSVCDRTGKNRIY